MTSGRTVWWGKDSAWWRREWIVELGEEFGSDGPAVIDWLSCEAKAQNDGGFVKAGRKSVARGCFVNVVTVSHVLSRAVTLGLLDEFTERQGRFTCRISGWQADQERATAAARKAKERSRNAKDLGALSRSVTPCHETSLNRTEQNSKETSSLRSDVVEPPLDNAKPQLRNGKIDELFAYWQQQCGHPHAKLTPERKKKVEARLNQGYTFDQIKSGIDGAANNPPHDDDSSVVYDDLVSVCRNGGQLERYIARAGAADRDSPAALAKRLQARSKK
jgi:hypothetical protein